MELKKSRILNDESLIDFVCYRAKVNFIDLAPDRLTSLLRAHFKEVLDYIITTNTYHAGSISIRLARKETVLIPKKERQYWVLPNYSSAYSYSLKVSFSDAIRGNYYLRPCKEMLSRIADIVNSTPDLKLRINGKKAS